jgi:ketosteroid isomerase-like protein
MNDDVNRTGRELVEEVFARVRKADPSVADLFTDDAIVTGPAGYEVVGRAAIRDHYERNISAHGPQPRIELIVADHPHYVAIVNVGLRDGNANRALDLFEIKGEKISRLEIWSQRG